MNHFIRQQYLDAIGIQSWRLKSAVDDQLPELIDDYSYPSEPDAELIESKPESVSQELNRPSEPEPEPESDDRSEFITEPVITEPEPETFIKNIDTVKQAPDIIEPQNQSVEPVDSISCEAPSIDPQSSELDPDLEQSIQNCKQCSKRQTRLNALSGQGASHAPIFVISEPPTADEDRAGHYLSQQSSTLFQSMLQCIDLKDKYFFTGIIKCYSLTDYLFSDDEITHCAPFLQSQIDQVQPAIIYVLGAKQAQSILQTKQSFNELRGKVHSISINNHQYSVIVSYHPAYLLRNPVYKREALNDLILMKSLLK